MMDLVKRWRWALLVAALLLLGLLYAFWPASTLVDMGEVDRGPMAVGVTDDGVTRAEEYYSVSAPVTGYLDRIELEAGDQVERGMLITRMRGRPATPLDRRSLQELRGALSSAEAAAASVTTSLEQSRRDLARAEQLSERGFLARAQLEAAQTRVATGEANLAQARAEAVRIRALMAQPGGETGGAPVPVRAPASGSVMSVITESEGVIAEGTPLMTIGDSEQIEVVVDLLSREAVRVSPGDRVEIHQWGGPDALIGIVDRIEPYGRLKISALGIEEQRVNVIIRFAPEARSEAARLGHGYQLDATIVLERRDDALRVPIGALFRGGDGGWRVFVDDGGRARERAVSLGLINDEHAEVLDGLAQGDTVVLNPGNMLEDGMRISRR
ncbi:efflux RND transporter periplasmic adaptor subunit [Alteraurantiacibacter aquimixticola]|uniref:Efflux RND transporter periplasmic adaptor subunit n=1 Tax=Alteraurantiacibacter aquimixticola TaxID=2489173 RepID=A0A4T3F0W3_9SPHN|nr:efflux RND transporter periplasmic adaptor subunit [Alteraurantiacibacter aquimixticola]TIX50711.1 efflux RND transporter periplasmic adaptor subunit [Alteraurantiacibacter aquimixticola]